MCVCVSAARRPFFLNIERQKRHGRRLPTIHSFTHRDVYTYRNRETTTKDSATRHQPTNQPANQPTNHSFTHHTVVSFITCVVGGHTTAAAGGPLHPVLRRLRGRGCGRRGGGRRGDWRGGGLSVYVLWGLCGFGWGCVCERVWWGNWVKAEEWDRGGGVYLVYSLPSPPFVCQRQKNVFASSSSSSSLTCCCWWWCCCWGWWCDDEEEEEEEEENRRSDPSSTSLSARSAPAPPRLFFYLFFFNSSVWSWMWSWAGRHKHDDGGR
jgi:hypothetical protein